MPRPTARTRSRTSASPPAPTNHRSPFVRPSREGCGGLDRGRYQGRMSAALDSRHPKRLDLLLAHCAEAAPRRKPVFERLREKIGVELARVLVFALAGSQRRSARRG